MGQDVTREQMNDYITRRLAWDDAVKASPHTCPNCSESFQVQIRDTIDEGGPLWKCRRCQHKFHTPKPINVPYPHIR